MSEYQFYDFRAIDRALTTEERNAVDSISSRAFVSARKARFVYNYGDFRGDPNHILETYFDAMVYWANYGCLRLMFRFPAEAVDFKAMQQYSGYGDCLNVYQKGDYVLFLLENGGEFEHDDYGPDLESLLDDLLPLRQAIMEGDYRALYLGWLFEMEQKYFDEDDDERPIEPPVPDGLPQLDESLQALVELFCLSQDVVVAAAETSTPLAEKPQVDLKMLLGQLPTEEKDDFLLRLASGEKGVRSKLQARLRKMAPVSSNSESLVKDRRDYSEIGIRAGQLEAIRKEEEKKKKEAAHQANMRSIFNKENEMWSSVFDLVGQKKTNSYDEAVVILKKLKDMSKHFDKMETYAQQIELLHGKFSRLIGFWSRANDKNLVVDKK
jgi:hypothetical protein